MIGCPETLVMNYHSTLHTVPEQRRSHMMIWQCRPWFGFCVVQFKAIQLSTSYANLRWPQRF